MTISNTASSATYTGNGSQQIFDVKDGAEGIYFEDASELYVTLRTDGTITPQTITTHYTVSGAGTDTGTITFLTAPSSGVEVRIERRTPLTQSLNLTAGGSFNPTNVMGAFDKLTRALQDQSRGGSGGEASGTYDGDPLTKDAGGTYWDGEDLPARGFAAPTDDDDLVTKSYGDANYGASAAAAAAASASAASTSASAASTSASAASTSASAASTSASDASTSASAASTSASNASTSASTASTQATNAATSATAAAAAAGFSFTYSTTTTMADPGSGVVRFNNATLASVTAIAIDDLSADTGNPDVSAWILTFDNSTATSKGLLRFRKKTAPQNFVDFVVTGLTDNSGWTELAVTHSTSSGSLSSSDALLMAFYATGDTGPAGAGSGDVNGPASSVASEIVLFDGTTGKLIKSATTTGIIKATSGVIAAAVSGTDYAPATSGSSILKGNGSGGFSNAASGTDYAPATSGTSLLKGNGSGGFSSTFAVAGGPPLTLNSHFKVWQRGTSISAASGGGAMTADRWICKFTDASSSATVARINEFTGGALVTFTNSITSEFYYVRQYVPGVMNFSNKTFTVVVDVETAETTLQYDFYINAEWNTSNRVNIVDTTAASLSNTRQIIRHTFTVSDLTGYGYTPTIDNGLDVAFRVITTTAMTSKTFKVHSISLFEGAGDFMPGFCDPEYEDQKLKRFYEVMSFYVPVVGLDTASGQKRAFFPFTTGKRKGASGTAVTYVDAVGNASKCSTYDAAGARTDNVTPTTVSVLDNGFQIIINSSTVAGIGAAVTASSDWL